MNVGNESHNNTSGERGLLKKGMDKYMQNMSGGIRIQELQKVTQILGTSHILRKALFIK